MADPPEVGPPLPPLPMPDDQHPDDDLIAGGADGADEPQYSDRELHLILTHAEDVIRQGARAACLTHQPSLHEHRPAATARHKPTINCRPGGAQHTFKRRRACLFFLGC